KGPIPGHVYVPSVAGLVGIPVRLEERTAGDDAGGRRHDRALPDGTCRPRPPPRCPSSSSQCPIGPHLVDGLPEGNHHLVEPPLGCVLLIAVRARTPRDKHMAHVPHLAAEQVIICVYRSPHGVSDGCCVTPPPWRRRQRDRDTCGPPNQRCRCRKRS